MNIEKSEVEKVPYLDGLRGIAALMVLFAHLMISLYPAVVTFTPSEIHTRFDVALGISPFSVFWRGNFAVCIFFVISGFVLSEFCQKTTISFPAQLVRRYLRLAIPMLITSAFAWLLLSISAYANYKAAVDVTHSGWLSMWYQFNPHFLKMAYEALYRAFVEGNAIYNSNLWTMRIELLGSAYIFLLHYLFRNKYLRLAIIVYWLMKTPHPSYYLLFAWGAFLYDFKDILLLSLKKIIPNYYGRSILVILGLIIGIYFGGYPELQPGMHSFWYNWFTKSKNVLGWHMLGAMLLVLCIFELKFIQKILGNKIGKFLGKISFVLYLIHLPIICSVTAWTVLITQNLPYWATSIISASFTLVVVISASALTYQYIDSHTTAFSRWAGYFFDKILQFKYKKMNVLKQIINHPAIRRI